MKVRRFTLDRAPGDAAPQVGEVMASARNLYRVTFVRPVESQVWPNRWHVETQPLGPHHGRIPEGASRSATYRRGEGPSDHFGPWPVDDPVPDT